MLYLTLEKAPEVTGLGPWMGVVQGERQVDSDYPEDKKARHQSIRNCVSSLHRSSPYRKCYMLIARAES